MIIGVQDLVRCLAVCGLLLAVSVACTDENGGGGAPRDGGTGMDATVKDATTDPKDAAADAPAPDATVADASPDGTIPDGAIPDGAIPDASPDASVVEPYILFVTSTLHKGNIGGLAAADAICQARALAGSLASPTQYVALLSQVGATGCTSGTRAACDNAMDRIADAARPIVANDASNTQIAANRAQLYGGTLDTAPRYDESGNAVVGAVHTGTAADGMTVFFGADADTCADWSSNQTNVFSTKGDPGVTSTEWTNQLSEHCNNNGRIYCIGPVE